MIPITFIILLIVVSLPGQIVANDHSSLNSLPQGPHAWVYLVSLVVWQLAVSFFVLFRTRKIVHQMHDSAAGSGDVANRADTLFGRARWATIVITAVHLATPLTRWILGHFQPLEILTAALVPELIFITPALLAWLVIWTASYFVEDAARQRALPFRLQQRLPVHEMPGLGSFLALQARHNFFPVVLVIVGAVVNVISTAVSRRFPDANDPRAAAATIAGTVVMFLILPFILVKVWSTTPMVGQLRTRLDLVAARYGLRFRNILLWRTHNLVMNAAILGWFPFARYFLLSDSLLEAFNDQQLESVFAHEVGHGIHRHLHWLIATGFSAVILAASLASILVFLIPSHVLGVEHRATLELISSGVLMIGLAAVLIPFIAPRFEHQADWFACRHMALIQREEPAENPAPIAAAPDVLAAAPTPAERVTIEQYAAGEYPHNPAHTPSSIALPGLPPAPESSAPRVSSTPAPAPGNDKNPDVLGTEVFISALDSLVEVSHRDRNRRGIFHPSVANRVNLLRRLAVDPVAEQVFNRSMRRTRYVIVGVVMLAIGAGLVANKIPATTAASPATASRPTTAAIAPTARARGTNAASNQPATTP